MYEAEVKQHLVETTFSPPKGWRVGVHLDPMEVCKGGAHPADKLEVTQRALRRLRELNVEVGINRDLRVDILARHDEHGAYAIEAKGTGRQQRELGLYSALGQLLTKVGEPPWEFRMGLAFPYTNDWERQVRKIPRWLIERLDLQVYLVSPGSVRRWSGPDGT